MTKEVQFNELVVWFKGVREKWLLGAVVLTLWPQPCEVMLYTAALITNSPYNGLDPHFKY